MCQRCQQRLRRLRRALPCAGLSRGIAGRALTHRSHQTGQRGAPITHHAAQVGDQPADVGRTQGLRRHQAKQRGGAAAGRLPIGAAGQLLLAQHQVVGQAVHLGLKRPTVLQEAAVGLRRKAQDDQVLQLNRQAHWCGHVDPLAEFGHRQDVHTLARLLLRKVRGPVRLHQ